MRLGRAMRAGVMAVVVVALAMGGLALAQTGGGDPAGPPVPAGGYERILDLLAPLVVDGTLTDSQAEAVAEHLSNRLPATDRRSDVALARLAELLGMTPAAIHEALAAGTSVAQLAEQQAIPPEEVVAALVAPVAERLAAAVAAGELSEAEAAERLEAATDRAARRIAGEHSGSRDRPRADALRDLLGITPPDLRGAIDEGLTLAELAESRDVAPEEVVSVLVAPIAERLDDVAEGALTEAEADERLADAEAEAAARIDEPLDTRRHDRPRRDRPRDRAPRDG